MLRSMGLLMVAEMLDGEPLPATIQTKEGLDHFGFAVEDMDAAAEELKGKGVKFVVEPLQVRPGLKIAYIEAPDKVRIELSERT